MRKHKEWLFSIEDVTLLIPMEIVSAAPHAFIEMKKEYVSLSIQTVILIILLMELAHRVMQDSSRFKILVYLKHCFQTWPQLLIHFAISSKDQSV